MRVIRGLAVALAVWAGGPPAMAIDVPTAQGPVQIAATPRRIAVFDIPAIDTIAALGVRIDGVPDRLYLPELAPLAKGAAVVGTLFEPDLEALSALDPDLIIIGGRSMPKLESVRRVAPAIDMTLSGTDLLGETRQRLTTYGALFGKQAAAAALSRDLDAAVAATRAAAQGKGKALIVMANGPKISVYGPGSRFGWLHKELGLPAAVAATATAVHGEIVSFEFIRQTDPEWLLVLDRGVAVGEAAGKATLANDLVAQTVAGKKNQIVYLPPGDFYIAAGGVPATMRVLTVLREAFAAAQ